MRKDVIGAATFMLLLAQSWAQSDCSPQYDGNGDGAVNTIDMLGLLSEFGQICDTNFPDCGVVTYNGYDYQTVIIGQKCWFAENLQTLTYQNGDSITRPQSGAEWAAAAEGCVTAYAEMEGTNCYEGFSPLSTPCDSSAQWNAQEFGLLYNGFVLWDPRGVCPSGWFGASDFDWAILEMHMGMPECEVWDTDSRGVEGALGQKLMIEEWPAAINATNEFGFSAKPSGIYVPTEQAYFWQGGGGNTHWWATTIVENNEMFSRNINGGSYGISRWPSSMNNGMAIRCVKVED